MSAGHPAANVDLQGFVGAWETEDKQLCAITTTGDGRLAIEVLVGSFIGQGCIGEVEVLTDGHTAKVKWAAPFEGVEAVLNVLGDLDCLAGSFGERKSTTWSASTRLKEEALAKAMKGLNDKFVPDLLKKEAEQKEAKETLQAVGIDAADKTIDLHHELRRKSTSEKARILAALAICTECTELELAFNNLDDEHASVVSGSVKCMPNLQNFSLHQNKIGGDGAKAIASAIHGLHSLECLDVRENKITEHGKFAITDAALPKLRDAPKKDGSGLLLDPSNSIYSHGR